MSPSSIRESSSHRGLGTNEVALFTVDVADVEDVAAPVGVAVVAASVVVVAVVGGAELRSRAMSAAPAVLPASNQSSSIS